jgi:hypothetical protein
MMERSEQSSTLQSVKHKARSRQLHRLARRIETSDDGKPNENLAASSTIRCIGMEHRSARETHYLSLRRPLPVTRPRWCAARPQFPKLPFKSCRSKLLPIMVAMGRSGRSARIRSKIGCNRLFYERKGFSQPPGCVQNCTCDQSEPKSILRLKSPPKGPSRQVSIQPSPFATLRGKVSPPPHAARPAAKAAPPDLCSLRSTASPPRTPCPALRP